MPTAAPELLTAAEVSARFRVSPSTVYRWGREQIVSSVKVGNTIRFRRSDVERLISGEAA